jgi:hypothetical protein
VTGTQLECMILSPVRKPEHLDFVFRDYTNAVLVEAVGFKGSTSLDI